MGIISFVFNVFKLIFGIRKTPFEPNGFTFSRRTFRSTSLSINIGFILLSIFFFSSLIYFFHYHIERDIHSQSTNCGICLFGYLASAFALMAVIIFIPNILFISQKLDIVYFFQAIFLFSINSLRAPPHTF